MNNILSALASWSNGGREPMDPTTSTSNEPYTDRADSPISADRAAKRRRRSPSCNDEVIDCDTAKQLALPPEVWADVMEFLPFDMILTCGAVSRSFLHETMPIITTLRIDKSAQMNMVVAARFRDVTDIDINCLMFTEMDEMHADVEVREESRIRAVPFLSRFARTLNTVNFGAKNEAGGDIVGFAPAAHAFWLGDEPYPNEGARESLMMFIDTLSGAFICGALPARLKISGLSCPSINDSINERRSFGSQCSTCQRACKSFPLESVIEFECRGSSIPIARSGRHYGLDVCLQKAEIESIIESRPGGKELLRSNRRLLTLLGSGRRYEIKSDGSSDSLVIVKYTKIQLEEMKRVIRYAELDVQKLSMVNLRDAVTVSFRTGDSWPLKRQCYLTDESLTSLRDDVGICIDRESIGGSVSDLLRYVKPICRALTKYYDAAAPHNELEFEEDQFEFEDIICDCFKIIRQFLELQNDALVQDIVDAKAVPCLISGLGNPEVNLEAATSLELILKNSKEEYRKIGIDAGVISKLCSLLEPFRVTPINVSISEIAVLSLINILADEKKEYMDAILKSGGLRKLLGLLTSQNDVLVDSALHLLNIAARDRVQNLLNERGLDSLFRIILSPEDHLNHLQKCTTLLCKLLTSSVFVQNRKEFAKKRLSKLAEALRRSENEIVQTNLALVCFKVVTSVKDEYEVRNLMMASNFLSTLVGLQDSPIDSVSEEATSCLQHIMDIKSYYEVESGEHLAWGEYRMLELVDSDEESSFSYEEALEVSDEQAMLEEEHAKDSNARMELRGSWVGDNDVDGTESPTLLGIPSNLLGLILSQAMTL
eukprot:scaffold2652_cov148-Skeletonema_marinoi.AAC.5